MLYISIQYTNKCKTISPVKLFGASLNRSSGINWRQVNKRKGVKKPFHTISTRQKQMSVLQHIFIQPSSVSFYIIICTRKPKYAKTQREFILFDRSHYHKLMQDTLHFTRKLNGTETKNIFSLLHKRKDLLGAIVYAFLFEYNRAA